MMNQDQVKERLTNQLTKIVFRKVNGDEREYVGTLNQSFLPVIDPDKVVKPRKANPAIQNIYLPGEGYWRSFKWEALISIDGEPFDYVPPVVEEDEDVSDN